MRVILPLVMLSFLLSSGYNPVLANVNSLNFNDSFGIKNSKTRNAGGVMNKDPGVSVATKRKRVITASDAITDIRKVKKSRRRNPDTQRSIGKNTNYNKINVAKNSRYDTKDIYNDFNTIFRNGRYVGHYKVGKTYKIAGLLYRPQEYEAYEEIGVASWYGEDFDGKLTANGEIYDLSQMTAAHRTLPLPSVVKVTNLENARSVIVRVNDRGPFAKSRIIDLSKKAAEMLDYKEKGTIMVKVELIKSETQALHVKLNIKQEDQ